MGLLGIVLFRCRVLGNKIKKLIFILFDKKKGFTFAPALRDKDGD